MFTRTLYDKGAYYKNLNESVGPGNWFLYPEAVWRRESACYQPIPEMHAANKKINITSDDGDLADTESELKNLYRINSKNPFKKYPFVQKKKLNKPPPLCHPPGQWRVRYSKLEGSQFNRERSYQWWYPQCNNWQSFNKIRSNNVIGMNTKLYYRDTYKPILPDLVEHTNDYSRAFDITLRPY